MENFCPIQIIDLRFQVDYINPKKSQLFGEYRNDANIDRLLLLLVRHRN